MLASPPSRLFLGILPWYSVLIVTGVVLAIILAVREQKRVSLPDDTILDLALFLLPAGIIGARLYYVVFSWDAFKNDLLSVFRIWEGGLAIYGGIIGGFLALVIFCRVRSLSLFLLCDLIVPGLALAQSIGRWGNYFNMEAYGAQVTNPVLQFFPFAVLITRESGSAWFMATFFYESLWNFLVFLFLLRGRRRSFRKTGDVFSFYLLLYGAGRLVIEDFRSDSLYAAGGVRISQLLSLCLCMAVLICFFIRRIRESKPMSPLALCLFLLVCAGAFPVFLDSLKLWSPVSDLLLHRFLMLASFSFCTIAAALVIYGKSTPEEVRYAVHTA